MLALTGRVGLTLSATPEVVEVVPVVDAPWADLPDRVSVGDVAPLQTLVA